MPPKRTGSKRKLAHVEEDEKAVEETTEIKIQSKPIVKRAKKGTASDSPAAPSGNDILSCPDIPRNTEFPSQLSFDRPKQGSLRITAWNITSLKSSEAKGLFSYLEAEDADILVLSETKVNDKPSHPKLAQYSHQYWGIGQKKGYAGIAILSKVEPIKVTYGLPTLTADSKGRIITLEFEHSFLVGTYCVNAGEGLKTMANKIDWNEAFAKYLKQLDMSKPVIWCGDFNVVLDDRDLAMASKKWNKSAGYTQIECDAHRALLTDNSLVDVWRERHPDAVGHFTFYGWRGMCRSKGIGWRLDSFVVSKRIQEKLDQCEIRHECYGASDHVPIVCDIQGPL